MILEILFFILLSPGLLLTLPPGEKGFFLSGETSILAVAIHAAIFGLFLYLFSRKTEGFQQASGTASIPYSNNIGGRQSARALP
jgi:hypothetical protein